MTLQASAILGAYKQKLTGFARLLASSEKASESRVGARLLICLSCNQHEFDQPCSICELGVEEMGNNTASAA